MKSSGSSSRAKSWASWSSVALLLLAACEGSKRAPGETEQWTSWRIGLTELPTPSGGNLKVILDGFVGRTNDDWLELAVNGNVVSRLNTYSPTGATLVLERDVTVSQTGILQVKVFDTVSNMGYSSGTLMRTGQSGNTMRVTYRGPGNVSFDLE